MKALISLFFLTVCLSLNAQKIIKGKIIWTENYQLEWVDFKAQPQNSHFASALSNIIFSINIKSEGNKLYVMIEPSFDPFASWVKKDHKSDYLLDHEQLHFDIYELNARKMRKELKGKTLTKSNAESVVNRLVKKYTKLNVKIQKRYDKSTNHSLKKKKQQKWKDKIRAELKEYKAYSEAEFFVVIH